MSNGLIHLYHGDGKGKTTAAMGLAVRALGCGRRVVIVQFLKDGTSGEIAPLRTAGATVYACPNAKFTWLMDENDKAQARAVSADALEKALAQPFDLLVLDEATAGLDPVVRGELLDLFLEFIQDERHSIVMSSHITADLEQIADSIAYLHNGQLLFQENKDDLLQEYGVLHCGESALPSLPADLVIFTKHGAFGCETLVKDRAAVRELLPDAVCDAAGLDDIMRFYSGRDAQ